MLLGCKFKLQVIKPVKSYLMFSCPVSNVQKTVVYKSPEDNKALCMSLKQFFLVLGFVFFVFLSKYFFPSAFVVHLTAHHFTCNWLIGLS